LSKQPKTLRLLQALSALLWISYGLIIEAMPVIAANVTVAALAIYTSRRQRVERKRKVPKEKGVRRNRCKKLDASAPVK
jgi:hypothetical protein